MSTFSHYLCFSKPKKRGFTLIELLVVIAIIGILAGIVFFSVNAAHVKARDAQRFKDMETMQGAIEIYFTDHGHYPITNNYASFDSPYYSSTPVIGNPLTPNTLTTALQPYLPTPLKDPSGAGGDQGYLYRSDTTGGSYCLLFWRLPENMNDFPASYIQMVNRCDTINSNGQCTTNGVINNNNNIYYSSANAPGC